MASIEETLALWAASLREIKKHYVVVQARACCGECRLFLEGLLSDEQRKTGWMRAEAAAILVHGGNRRSWVARTGMLMLCANIVRDYVIEAFGG